MQDVEYWQRGLQVQVLDVVAQEERATKFNGIQQGGHVRLFSSLADARLLCCARLPCTAGSPFPITDLFLQPSVLGCQLYALLLSCSKLLQKAANFFCSTVAAHLLFIFLLLTVLIKLELAAVFVLLLPRVRRYVGTAARDRGIGKID